MRKTALIFILLLGSYTLNGYPSGIFHYEISLFGKVLNEIQKSKFISLKATFLQRIKQSEGLMLKKYICTAGQNTIGYGHANRENLQCITVLQADSILQTDFEFALNHAKQQTQLECICVLPLANFVFAHGIGTFGKSKILTQKLYKNSGSLLKELLTYKKTPAARKARWFDKFVIEQCKH